MEQDDFRRLLTSGTPKTSNRSDTKRTRDQAFGGARNRSAASKASTSSSPISLAPRKVKASVSKTDTEPEEKQKSRTKLADGYIDRTRQRGQDSQAIAVQDQIDKLKRDLKDKKLTHKEYLAKVSDVAQGDFSGAGLVRGLDRKLLERVRAGEDVLRTKADEEQAELDAARAEDELEEVMRDAEKRDDVPRPVQQTTSRDELVARIRKSRSKVETKEESDKPKDARFKPITKRNADGTTTETFMEDGKKIKLIKSAEGVIIKKLVKKVEKQTVPAAPSEMTEPSAARAEQVTLPIASSDLPSADADEDIFADVGEYDPFDDTGGATDSTQLGPGNYFGQGDEDEAETSRIPTTEAEFLLQNKTALDTAAAIVARQKEAEQARFTARKRQDAGFGLVFSDGDAYAADMREVPEEDEIFDPKQARRGKKVDKKE